MKELFPVARAYLQRGRAFPPVGISFGFNHSQGHDRGVQRAHSHYMLQNISPRTRAVAPEWRRLWQTYLGLLPFSFWQCAWVTWRLRAHTEVSCAGCARRDELRVSRRRARHMPDKYGVLYLPAGIE